MRKTTSCGERTRYRGLCGNIARDLETIVQFEHEMAETERFELSVQMYPYDGLANRWFQPLTHVSGA